MPLVSNDEVVGLIDVFDVRERDYNDVRWFLPEAGRTVADALRNADLLARLRRGNAALRELVELGDRLNEAGTLEELAKAVAERLRSVLAAEDCDIWQVDGGVLRCLASVDSRGWDADEVGSERELADLRGNHRRPRGRRADGDRRPRSGRCSARRRGEPTGAGASAAWSRFRWSSTAAPSASSTSSTPGSATSPSTWTSSATSAACSRARSRRRCWWSASSEATDDLRLLVDSGLEFGATLDVDAVLLTVAERIVQVSEADLCDVLRLDGDEVEILLAIGEDWEDEPVGQAVPARDYGTFIEAARDSAPGRDPRRLRRRRA